MQFSVFAFVLLVASAFAIPEVKNERPPNIVEQRVINAVNRYIDLLRRLGLDPLKLEDKNTRRVLVPGFFEVRTEREGVVMTGGSDVRLEYVDYNILLGRLRVDFLIPELRLKIGKAGVQIHLGENVDSIELAGSLSIRDVTLAAEISFNANLEDGITVRSITIDLSIEEVKSELELVVFERNYSDYVNTLLGEHIPGFLKLYKNEINRGMEVVIRRILESVL